MKIKKKICIWMTACCTLFMSTLKLQAAGSWPEGPAIVGEYAVVMELDTGTVLYEKNAHTKLYPASTTKILTALLALENSKMEEKVTFSYDSVHKTEGSGIWRDVDEVMTMEQCMYALMLNSANECAYAIAEHVGGSFEEFVKMMNDRAQALGCENTHFTNPHGLTDEEHYTSCYDLALISREAFENDMFRQITATKRYEIPPTNKHPDEITYLKNHQKMLFEDEEYYYEYCVGGKTGYTEAAAHTLVTFAEKDGMTLVCVVMKEEIPNHFEDSITLLDYCFDHFRTYNIEDHLGDDLQQKLPKSNFLSRESFVDIEKGGTVVLPSEADFSEVEKEFVTGASDQDTVGTLEYRYGEHVIGKVNITRTDLEIKAFPFGKHQLQVETDQQKPKKIIRLNVLNIILIIAGIVVLGAVIFGIYKFGDNFYFIRYKFRSRRGHNAKDGILKQKRWKRKRKDL
jgi:D-alanyl-D-alanine carboxypeptidase (penicillin-binding protein 5/6)